MSSGESSGDIFDHENRVLESSLALIESGGASHGDHEKLTQEYRKLLKTTRRIIKLSDKSEERLTQLSNEAQETNRQLEGLSTQLSKYLSPQLYQSIFTGNKAVARASSRKKLTIFFSDLCSFTNIVENLESEDVAEMLNLYLGTMTEIALKYGATVDKYIGDAVMLFFGDPESRGVKEDAVACLNMAMEMQTTLKGMSDNWHRYGLQEPLRMRIGIATGFCTVGNFGSDARLEYTCVGAGVNLASRLETAADPDDILMSFDTYSLVSDRIPCQELETINVKGIGPVRTFKPIFEGEEDASRLTFEIGSSMVNTDISHLTTGELESAHESLEKAVEKIRNQLKEESAQEQLL
jgi:class 3 adenylate cyclase